MYCEELLQLALHNDLPLIPLHHHFTAISKSQCTLLQLTSSHFISPHVT
jgi:hypothetical protein